MAPKLGEILIKAGKISPEDLDEALASQIFFGGKLGTHLIEMGCIDEYELMRFLSRITGIPTISNGQLESVPPDTIALISAEMAQTYRMIPLHLTNKRLEVAMADPVDFVSIDEISFATGFIIIPRLASEPTIARFLQKHYQVEQKRRLLRIEGESRHRQRPETKTAAGDREPEPLEPAGEEALLFPSNDDFKGFHMEQEEQEAPPLGTSAPEPAAHSEKPSLAEEISTHLCNAEGRDAVATLLLNYAGTYFDRAALFMIKKEMAAGWMAVVRQRRVPGFGELAIPLDSSSILSSVVGKKAAFNGKRSNDRGDVRIWECLGEGSDDAVALPLLLLDRVVAVLYVSGNTGTANMKELQKISIKSTMALEILILKNKILMT